MERFVSCYFEQPTAEPGLALTADGRVVVVKPNGDRVYLADGSAAPDPGVEQRFSTSFLATPIAEPGLALTADRVVVLVTPAGDRVTLPGGDPVEVGALEQRFATVWTEDVGSDAGLVLTDAGKVELIENGTAVVVSRLAQAVLADRPLAYWQLGEASGVTARDSSGNGYNGTYSGGVTLGATGLVATNGGAAVGLDGVDGLVSAPAAWPQMTAFTIECWFRGGAPSDNWGPFLVKDPTEYDFWLGGSPDSDPTQLYFEVGFNCPDAPRQTVTVDCNGVDGPVALWEVGHHIAGVFTGTDLICYLDGVEVGTRLTGITHVPTHNGGPANIGGDDFSDWLHGTINDVAAYDHGLSAERILAHYQAGTET